MGDIGKEKEQEGKGEVKGKKIEEIKRKRRLNI
jgi:hypothetical protein